MKLRASRIVVAITLSAFLSMGLPMGLRPAQAGLIGAPAVIGSEAGTARSANLARVEAALARADVRHQLQALGVDAEAATARVAALTDEELAQLSGRLDNAPAGGEILALIGAVFIVLIILDYLGVTKVFRRH